MRSLTQEWIKTFTLLTMRKLRRWNNIRGLNSLYSPCGKQASEWKSLLKKWGQIDYAAMAKNACWLSGQMPDVATMAYVPTMWFVIGVSKWDSPSFGGNPRLLKGSFPYNMEAVKSFLRENELPIKKNPFHLKEIHDESPFKGNQSNFLFSELNFLSRKVNSLQRILL